MDPALVSVQRVAKDRQNLNSEEVSSTPVARAKKNKSAEESSSKSAKYRKTQRTSESTRNKGKSVEKHVSLAKVSKSSMDSKLEAMDQKWSERFSRLEAMVLSKTQPARACLPVSCLHSSQACTSGCC